jgi:hypothetical protein
MEFAQLVGFDKPVPVPIHPVEADGWPSILLPADLAIANLIASYNADLSKTIAVSTAIGSNM